MVNLRLNATLLRAVAILCAGAAFGVFQAIAQQSSASPDSRSASPGVAEQDQESNDVPVMFPHPEWDKL